MSVTTLVTFIVYIIGMLLIGVYMYRRTTDLSDYVLGGRSLGPAVAALSAGASDMSGWLLLALPGAIYASGISESWLGIGLATGAFLNWQFIARRLRVYTEVSNNAITIPDFLENRFNDKSRALRVISAIVILVFFTFYTSSGMVAGAKLFESSFGLSYQWALWIGVLVVVSYTFLGGFLAVVWTDFIQGTLMLLALIAAPIAAISAFGGWGETVQAVGELNINHLSMVKGVGAIAIISSLAWGLGYFGQPHIIVRFMAMRSAKDVPVARFIGTTWMILGLYGAIFTGFVGFAYVASADASIFSAQGIEVIMEDGIQVLADEETIFIVFAQVLFHPLVAGLILAAIMSAIMSTVDSQLLVSSSAVAEDFYKGFFRKKASDKELVWVGRIATVAIALIAGIIATNPDSKVLDLVSYAWAGFGASFGPIIVLSLFWRGITRNGALWGIIVGATTVIIWGDFLSGGIFDLYEMVPGFFLNLIVTIVISKMGKPDEVMTDHFDKTMEELHK
ncbi:MAG TPA: sodium/proline symporter PutP [Pseudogracilibacillus sp.]|nr:sodium/proline symporter PutP [Pseudogracilibacillus sp.]